MRSWIPQEMRARTRSNLTVVCGGILLTAVIIYFGRIWGVFTSALDAALPFFIGFAIAFILLPAVARLERLFNKTLFRRKPHPRLNRALATILSFLLLLILVVGFLLILVPQVIDSLRSMLQFIAKIFPKSAEEVSEMLRRIEFMGLGEVLVNAWENAQTELLNYVSQLDTYTSTLLTNVLALAGSISTGVYSVVFHFLVGLIAAIYLLLDKERFCAQAKKICYALMKKSSCETLIYWTRRANHIFAGFITGKLLDSLIIGVICYVCMLVFHIEYALLISVIVGVTNIIPFFGPFIGAVPSALILLMVNPLSALWFVIFVIILQQLDGNVIGPLILGDYVGLSAFWIMLAIVVGGSMFGFLGMLLSVPTFALIYAIIHSIIDNNLQKRGLPTDDEFYEGAPDNIPKEFYEAEEGAHVAKELDP